MKYISRYISTINADFYINYFKEHNIFPIKSCFDIGSAAGVFVDKLNELGIKSEGIEQHATEIQSKNVREGSFDESFTTPEKYDLISLPQVIYFLGDFESICLKLKSMLNPKGVLFIVITPVEFKNKITFSGQKIFPLPTKSEIENICNKLGFDILDITSFQSNIGVAFNQGKLKAIFRLLLFVTGMKKPIIKNPNGNNLYLLLKSKT